MNNNSPTKNATSFTRAIVLVLVVWSFLFVFGVKPLAQKIETQQARVTAAQQIYNQMAATVALEKPLEARRHEIESRLGRTPTPIVARVDELAALREAAQRYGLTIQARSLDTKGALLFGTTGPLDSTLRLIDGLAALPSPALVKSVQLSASDQGRISMTLTGNVLGEVR